MWSIWPLDFPGDTIEVVGDRDNLVNPFNFQGEVFMLDGDILTIHPDSLARFQIQFDHTAAGPLGLWKSCLHYGFLFFPPCGERVTTDEIRMCARASIRLFENQTIPLVTDDVDFSIWYFFNYDSHAYVEVEEIGVGWTRAA